MKKRILNRALIAFFNGIVVILPIALTVTIIRFVVIKVNEIVLEPLLNLIPPMVGRVDHIILAKSLIFIGVILIVSLVGWGAKVLVINRFFSYWEALIMRLPIMGRMYKTIKQISSALIGQGKTIFKQVVLVEYPRKGVYTLGFTTGVVRGHVKEALEGVHITVFIPTTPNPTSGFFLIIPKDEIRFLDMTVEEGMKMVVSGGAVIPDHVKEETEES